MNPRLRHFLRHCFLVYLRNPGGWNMDAILVLSGAFVWAACAIHAQIFAVPINPEVTEIGKACIFVGIGRASKEGKLEVPAPKRREK